MSFEESPLRAAKAYDESSVFHPENLLREGRRQRNRPDVAVPKVCLLDPDGDIVRHLASTGAAVEHPGWACYHTTLWVFDLGGTEVGVIGCAVGASFAVLLAEQLAVSGCELLVSVTSSGSITPIAEPPYFVIIDKALRDEGTSHHYLPPTQWADAPVALLDRLDGAFPGRTNPSCSGRPGPPTLPIARRPRRSSMPNNSASSPSRWRPPPCTPTPLLGTRQ